MSVYDSDCEKHFATHTTREASGRFCIKLPLKDSADCLLAKRRFLNIEKRFKRYNAELGHITLLNIDPNEMTIPNYHLCHHAVLK